MQSTATATQNVITLKGSVKIVTEFFGYSIQSILYQRAVYPPEFFERVNAYGISMLVTEDEKLKSYLKRVLEQMADWLVNGEVSNIVLIITGVDTKQTLERWTFNVEADQPLEDGKEGHTKSDKELVKEIQAVIRQITASVSFLPLLEEPCTFDLLVYTSKDAKVPAEWEESDPKYINNSTEVRLKSFSTKVHKVTTKVAYRNPDNLDV